MTARAGNTKMFASHDILRLTRMALDVCAGIVVRTNRGTFERDSRKKAAGSRIAENLGAHPGVGIRGGVTSFWPCRNGSVAAELDLAAQDRIHTTAVHNQED